MVKPQLLRRSQIEVGFQSVGQERLGHRHVAFDHVFWHGTPDLLGSFSLFGHANAKRGNVVVKEVYEVVGVDLYDDVRASLFDVPAHLHHQGFGAQLTRGVLYLPGQPRRVRHPGGQNYLSHSSPHIEKRIF